MDKIELQRRTKAFAIRVIRLVDSLPRTRAADVLGRQLLRAATSVGANYRSACRARSRPDFLSKLGIVEEECDEAGYWLDLLAEASLIKRSRLSELLQESNELTAIVVASIRTARKSSTRST